MLHGFNFVRQQYSQLAKPGGGNQSAIATVQTLAERLVKTDVTLEDRRAAVLALKGLSRDHNRAVGQHALPALLQSLQRDSQDEELARALVECCITLCEVQDPSAPQPPKQQHKHNKAEQAPPAGLQHTDLFLQEPGPLHCLLPLLAPNRAFYTRFASLQLLGSLLRNRPHRVQDHVLVAPGGCGAVLECLAEGAGSSAEIVRNEALLLLPHLVHGNADIQKLVAFEGAFEKLLDVCAAEGRIEGGVIVQDALEGLEALLRYNVSNQNYFRETLSVPMLAPLLFYPPGPANNTFASKHAEHEYARSLEAFSFQDWDAQKMTNAKLVLGIAALLVGGQGEGRKANQNALLQCGMTKCLLDLALASTAPPSLKAKALHVAASLLQASRANQDLLTSLSVQPVQLTNQPSGEEVTSPTSEAGRPSADVPPQPTYTRADAQSAVHALVATALGTSGAKGGLGLRAAALACFRAYVADNMDARLAILHEMTAAEDRSHKAGRLLLDGLVQNPATQAETDRSDAHRYLVSAILVSYLLRSSESAKEAARLVAVTPEGQIVKRELKPETDDDDDDDDDAPAALIQVIVGNLTLAERELADAVRKERAGAMGATVASSTFSAADWTRIMVGYLVLLSTWLYESPLSVRDFLSESATLQAVIQPVAQSSGIDPLIQGLAAFLLGIAYEFDTDPGKAAVTRSTMHPILHSRIGADQFAVRISRLAEDVRFRNVTPDILEKMVAIEEDAEAEEARVQAAVDARAAAARAAAEAAAAAAAGDKPATMPTESAQQKVDEEAADKDLEVNGLGHLSAKRRVGMWFEWTFVEFWRMNATLITKSILVDPASSSAAQAGVSAELLDAHRQAEALKDTVAKQVRDIEALEKRIDELTTAHTQQTGALQTELETAQAAAAEHAPRLEAVQREMADLATAHGAQLEPLQAQLAALENQLNDAKAGEEAANGKIVQLTAEIARISASKPSAKEFAALQKQLDDMRSKRHADADGEAGAGSGSGAGNVAMQDLVAARELADARDEHVAQLQAQLLALEQRPAAETSGAGTDEVQTELAQISAQKHELEQALASYKASVQLELETLRADAERMTSEKSVLQGELATATAGTAHLAQLESSLAEQRSAVQTLQTQLDDARSTSQAGADHAQTSAELERKLADAENKLQSALTDATQAEKKHSDQLKAAESKLKDVQAKLKDVESKHKDVQSKLKDAEGKLKDVESKHKAAETKLKDVEGKHKTAETKLKDVEGKHKDVQSKLKTAETAHTDSLKTQEEAVAKASSLEAEVKTLNARIKTLESAATAKSKDTKASADSGELETLRKEKEETAKENEDLLVLLEELSQKRRRDKKILASHGESVSESDDDDDDDDNDDVD